MNSTAELTIAGRRIGSGHPCFVVAELSANHAGSLDRALQLVHLAAAAGADAVKIQTYTADTITLDSDAECFRIKGTIWDGRRLHDLYREAHTPWDWHPTIFAEARKLGLIAFSTPFDPTAVDFLETLQVPCHKIASFELVDIGLLEKVGATRKPVILSTGMAALAEIDEAVRTLRGAGCPALALLKCTSAYPAPAEEMNLRTIPHLAEAFGATAGLSDHTLGATAAVAAVALGAAVVEKHLCVSRSQPGPDSAFSMEPQEFREMVIAIRLAESALGRVSYDVTPREAVSRTHRRSLFVAEDIAAGEKLTERNVRSVRPADGLHPRHLRDVLGRTAVRALKKGTPLRWELLY
jgi:N-acetylneuraminate synthase